MAALIPHPLEGARQSAPGAWVAAAVGCGGVATFAVGLFAASLPDRYRQLVAIGAGDQSLADHLRGVDPARVQAALVRLHLPVGFYATGSVAYEVAFALVFTLVAAAVARHRRHRWFSLLTALGLVLLGTTYPPTLQGLTWAQPDLEPLARLLRSLGFAFALVNYYVFPDGRFVPRWTGPLALVWIAWQVGSALLPTAPFSPWQWPSLLASLVTLPLWLSGLAAQVYRYRRESSPAQRQQTKWVLWGLAGAALGTNAAFLLPQLFVPSLSPTPLEALVELGTTPLADAFVLFAALSLGIAIVHYRLWDIDLLINRSLVYGALSLILAGGYLGGVVLLQSTLRALTGQTSDLATVGSTLAMAASIQPLRWRVQALIDRGFYRRKYDATRVLGAFGATARDEVDLGRLTTELLRLVEDTMQPTHVSVWLRPVGPEARRGQVDPAT